LSEVMGSWKIMLSRRPRTRRMAISGRASRSSPSSSTSPSTTRPAGSGTSRSTDVELAGPTVLGRKVTRGGTEILSGGLDGKHDFSGEGETTQSNSLSGSIAVTVVEALPHGRLRIRGEKRLRINGDVEHIRLEGVVRTVDIAPDNTVRSTQVAEARISYVGKGTVADASRMGWLARFFQSVIWPF